MLSAFKPTHYFSDIYTHLGVMLYSPSSYPGRNICASLAWWSGSRGHWNEAGIVTANVCTTQSYQAVLIGFHSGMSLKTEKGCLYRSPSPGTYKKGVLWSAQNPLHWICEHLSILLTLKRPIFHFSRHCISSLDKGLFYSRQCWITKVEVD